MMISKSDIEQFLPQYLGSDFKEALKKSLDKFPDNLDEFYMTSDIYEKNRLKILQSDIFECKNIFFGKDAKVMVISNSCDNSDENIRDAPICISFVIILSLSKIKELYEKKIQDANIVKTKINAIKNQHITTMFYLPRDDMVALFDRTLHLEPDVFKEKIIKKVASLSNYGFYAFLFKLSYHFTRLREGTQRG